MQLVTTALQPGTAQSAFTALQQLHQHRERHLLAGPRANGRGAERQL